MSGFDTQWVLNNNGLLHDGPMPSPEEHLSLILEQEGARLIELEDRHQTRSDPTASLEEKSIEKKRGGGESANVK